MEGKLDLKEGWEEEKIQPWKSDQPCDQSTLQHKKQSVFGIIVQQKAKQLHQKRKKSWRSFQQQDGKQRRGTNKEKKVVCTTSKHIERSCRPRARPAIQVDEGGDYEINLVIFQAISKE